MQAACVGQDRCRLKLALEADLGGGEAGLPVLGSGRGDLGHSAWPQAQLQRGGLGGGQRLQVLHNPAQPQHLFVPRGGLLRCVGHDAVKQRLGVGLQHCHRGLQLVGDVGYHAPSQLLLGNQGVCHLVEGDRQLTQLSRGARNVIDSGPPVPAAHRPGRLDQADDRPGDPPGNGQPNQQRQQRG